MLPNLRRYFSDLKYCFAKDPVSVMPPDDVRRIAAGYVRDPEKLSDIPDAEIGERYRTVIEHDISHRINSGLSIGAAFTAVACVTVFSAPAVAGCCSLSAAWGLMEKISARRKAAVSAENATRRQPSGTPQMSTNI